MAKQKDKITFVEMITINVMSFRYQIFLEFRVRKIQGSEIKGMVQLHMSRHHKETHFLKYASKVQVFKKSTGVNMKNIKILESLCFLKTLHASNFRSTYRQSAMKDRDILPPNFPLMSSIIFTLSPLLH